MAAYEEGNKWTITLAGNDYSNDYSSDQYSEDVSNTKITVTHGDIAGFELVITKMASQQHRLRVDEEEFVVNLTYQDAVAATLSGILKNANGDKEVVIDKGTVAGIIECMKMQRMETHLSGGLNVVSALPPAIMAK